MDNKVQSANKLKIAFRMLPVLGILLIAFGAWQATARMNPITAPVLGSVGLGVLLFLTLFVKAEVANIKYYLNVFVYSAAVATVCVVGYLFARSHTQQVDLTKNKFYSLSDQSENVLKSLKKNNKTVEVAVFTATAGQLRWLEDQYSAGGKNLKWTYIDAKKEPLKTREYGDNLRYGDVVIKSGQKRKQMTLQELMDANYENTFTNALIEVSREKDIKIYFLSGHGELALEAPAQSMMRQRTRQNAPTAEQFKKNLTAQALKTDTLNLVQKGFVPEDAAMVIIASPQNDITAAEAAALEKYLNGDGKLLITLDVPLTANPAMIQPQTNLKGLLKKFGVDAPEQVVLDLIGNQFTGSAATPAVMWMNPEQKITSDFAGSRMFSMLLGEARPVQPAAEPAPGYEVTPLLKTSPQSWAVDLSRIGEQITPPAQFGDPPSVAVAVSPQAPPSQPGMPPPPEPKGGMRMVVFGTSDLVADDMQRSNQLAVSLMMNSINWLTQQEDLIAIPPRSLVGTPIVLEKPQLYTIFFLAILLIPGALFFGGMSYSLMRRRR